MRTPPLLAPLVAVLVVVTATASTAAAHPGHGDEMVRPLATEAAVRARVESEVRDLVDAKKIDAAWSKVPLKQLGRVSRGGASQWLALFENPKAKTDRELFLFTNVYGDIVEGGFAMDEAAALARAKTEIERLVAIKKLAPSWQPPSPPKLEQRAVGSSWEWVAVIDNAADVEHPRLWIFLKPYGDFVAANHTGT